MNCEWDRRMAPRPANPAALPEHYLWTLTEDGHSAEAVRAWFQSAWADQS